VYSGVLQFAEESIKHTPAGRVIRLVDLASGTVHAVASNGGFNERAYISAASSYAAGALGSALGSFAGPLGAALGATAGSYFGAKAGEFLYDNPTFVADKLAELEDLGGELARAVEDGIANLSETALDSYENFANEAETFLEDALGRLEQFSRNLGGEFTQLADALADLAQNLGDALGDALGGLWGGLQGEGDGDGGLTGAAGMLAPAGIAGVVVGLFAAAGLISPLVLDLDGDGIELSTLAETGALFDLDGDGFAEKTGASASSAGR
jgi:hypothetical protein